MRPRFFFAGAALYMLWGVQHVVFGGTFLASVSTGGVPGVLELSDIETTIPEQDFPGLVEGLLAWHSFNIILFGVAAITAGLAMMWTRSRQGYWFNVVAIGAFELGFVGLVLIPGHIEPSVALSGPIIYLAATVLSSLGRSTP